MTFELKTKTVKKTPNDKAQYTSTDKDTDLRSELVLTGISSAT